MTRDVALEIAARCWCDKRNSGKVMDPDLAESIADALMQVANDERELVEIEAVMGATPVGAAAKYTCDGIGFQKCGLPATWTVQHPSYKPEQRHACDRCKRALETVRDERERTLAGGEGFHLDGMTFAAIGDKK